MSTTTGGTAGAVRDEAVREAADLTHRAAEQAGAVAEQAKRQTARIADDARHELQRQGDEQARRVAGGLHDTGRQLRTMAEAGEGLVADLAQQASERVERVARTLDERGVEGVAEDVRGFARRRPGLFLAAAGAAGFVAARAIRHQRTGDGSGPSATTAPAGEIVLDTPEPSPALPTPSTPGRGFPT
jgi:hypothetical protein